MWGQHLVGAMLPRMPFSSTAVSLVCVVGYAVGAITDVPPYDSFGGCGGSCDLLLVISLLDDCSTSQVLSQRVLRESYFLEGSVGVIQSLERLP